MSSQPQNKSRIDSLYQLCLDKIVENIVSVAYKRMIERNGPYYRNNYKFFLQWEVDMILCDEEYQSLPDELFRDIQNLALYIFRY